MSKSLAAGVLSLGILAFAVGPALAGGGCSSVTAHSGSSLEVAQIDQSSVPLPQTPQPEGTAK